MTEAATGDGGTIEVDPKEYRRVMGQFPTGVTVVAAESEGRPVGLAIGSFFSISIDPPLVGFCVGNSSYSWPLIEAAGCFGISVLAEDQHETSNQFAGKAEDKFAGIHWDPSAVTCSPMIRGAVAHIDCTLEAVHPGPLRPGSGVLRAPGGPVPGPPAPARLNRPDGSGRPERAGPELSSGRPRS